MGELDVDLKAKMARAMERRFGASCMPYEFRRAGERRWRVRDPETGSWAEFDVSAWRIRRVAELDAA